VERLPAKRAGGVGMFDKDNLRWMELCQLAAHEQDPKKLTELFAEINRILAAKNKKEEAQREPGIQRNEA
jgi:hypothetical protein